VRWEGMGKDKDVNETFSTFENWLTPDMPEKETENREDITTEFANQLIEKEILRRKNVFKGINCDG